MCGKIAMETLYRLGSAPRLSSAGLDRAVLSTELIWFLVGEDLVCGTRSLRMLM